MAPYTSHMPDGNTRTHTPAHARTRTHSQWVCIPHSNQHSSVHTAADEETCPPPQSTEGRREGLVEGDENRIKMRVGEKTTEKKEDINKKRGGEPVR